jgi:hypothetical protein
VTQATTEAAATETAATETAAAAVLTLLSRRAAGATICPSEAARALDPAAWRDRMAEVHAAARALAEAGRVDLTQGGRPSAQPRGAYRIAAARSRPDG